MRGPCEWAVGDHGGGAVGKMGEKAERVMNGAGGERCAWGMRQDHRQCCKGEAEVPRRHLSTYGLGMPWEGGVASPLEPQLLEGARGPPSSLAHSRCSMC